MPSILQKQTTRETDPLTLRGEVANTAIPIILGTTASPVGAGTTRQLTTGQASVGHYIIKAGASGAGANATAVYTISCSDVGETFLDGVIDADSYTVDVSITSMSATAQSNSHSVGTIEAAITGTNTIVIRRAASQVSSTLLAGNINLRLQKREFDLEELVA